MPPRLNLLGASRSIAIRSRPSIASRQPRLLPRASQRYFADEKTPESPPPATRPNQDVLGHVSEEAADMGKVTGETGPDLGQGTPVQEVCFPISLYTPSSLRQLPRISIFNDTNYNLLTTKTDTRKRRRIQKERSSSNQRRNGLSPPHQKNLLLSLLPTSPRSRPTSKYIRRRPWRRYRRSIKNWS